METPIPGCPPDGVLLAVGLVRGGLSDGLCSFADGGPYEHVRNYSGWENSRAKLECGLAGAIYDQKQLVLCACEGSAGTDGYDGGDSKVRT